MQLTLRLSWGQNLHSELGLVFTAEDTGGKIKGNRMNIYMETHEEATEFGIQRNLKAYILEEPQKLEQNE